MPQSHGEATGKLIAERDMFDGPEIVDVDGRYPGVVAE